MDLLHLTLSCMLHVFFSNPALTCSTPPEATMINAAITTNTTAPVATNIILQSKDGGQTWQDISRGLPVSVQPEDFFAGESDVYMRMKNELYRSKSNLATPVWEKENIPDLKNPSIALNPSGTIAFSYEGKMYRKSLGTGNWLPVYTSLKKHSIENIFETSAGTIFVCSDNGLYKSTDKGIIWKQVQNEGWVMDLVESEGVLIATGQKGIMRSIDNGEHWEWVISDSGVGIAVERIDGGFAAVAYSSTHQIRKIYISMDSGKTWKTIDEGLYPSLSISSIKQMGKILICGHPDGIFRSADTGKTWHMVHANVTKNNLIASKLWYTPESNSNDKVFKLYVAGNVLYAVVRDFGC